MPTRLRFALGEHVEVHIDSQAQLCDTFEEWSWEREAGVRTFVLCSVDLEDGGKLFANGAESLSVRLQQGEQRVKVFLKFGRLRLRTVERPELVAPWQSAWAERIPAPGYAAGRQTEEGGHGLRVAVEASDGEVEVCARHKTTAVV